MELRVNGHPVFAATGGKTFDPAKPGVIFLHGAGNDHTVWQLPARYFAYHGRSVLAVDLPGHGRSGGDPLASVDAIADWVVDLVETSGLKETALAGHSMGALIALAAAAKLKKKVTALALLGVAGRIPVHPNLLEAAKRNDHVAFEMIVAWGFGPKSQIGGHRAPGVWMTGGGMRLLERIRDGVFGIDLEACDAFDGAETLAAAVACPTLLVLGERDRLTPPKGARELAGHFKDARMVVIPDSGHMMLAENPDETLDALREVL